MSEVRPLRQEVEAWDVIFTPLLTGKFSSQSDAASRTAYASIKRRLRVGADAIMSFFLAEVSVARLQKVAQRGLCVRIGDKNLQQPYAFAKSIKSGRSRTLLRAS